MSEPGWLFCKVIHNHNQRSPFFINFLWTTTPIKWPKIGVLTPNFINKCTRQCGSKILRNSYALRHFCNVLYLIQNIKDSYEKCSILGPNDTSLRWLTWPMGILTGHLGFQYNWKTVQFDQHIFKTQKYKMLSTVSICIHL